MVKKKQTQIDEQDRDFFTLLAAAAEEDKERIVMSILAQVKAGDSTAFKMLEKALMQRQVDEGGRPIVFMPIEIMDREGIKYELPATSGTEDDSEG